MNRSARLAFALTCLVASACDDKRSGQVSLTGAGPIQLIDRSGAVAELSAGPAEVELKKDSRARVAVIRLKQNGREVNVQAPLSEQFYSGSFTLRGETIGQPVTLVSKRVYENLGELFRYTDRIDIGWEECEVDSSYRPCDEVWTVDFRSAGADALLGTFVSNTKMRCEERQGAPHNCRSRREREPRDRDHGDNGSAYRQLAEGQNLKFN